MTPNNLWKLFSHCFSDQKSIYQYRFFAENWSWQIVYKVETKKSFSFCPSPCYCSNFSPENSAPLKTTCWAACLIFTIFPTVLKQRAYVNSSQSNNFCSGFSHRFYLNLPLVFPTCQLCQGQNCFNFLLHLNWCNKIWTAKCGCLLYHAHILLPISTHFHVILFQFLINLMTIFFRTHKITYF